MCKVSKPHLFQYSFLKQALFLSTHNKVMCLIFVINNVLQINTSVIFQVLKKLLIEDKCHSTDFLDSCLLFCVSVLKVLSNTYSKFTTEFFPFEAFQCRSPTICPHDDVKIKFVEGMRWWVKGSSPSMCCNVKQIKTKKGLTTTLQRKSVLQLAIWASCGQHLLAQNLFQQVPKTF